MPPHRADAVDLDEIDRELLRLLSRHARASISALAGQVHVSRANAYARVQRLVSDGVIDHFTAQVSPEALGLRASAYVHLNITQDSWRQVRAALAEVEGVDHVALCSGEVDVVALVRTADIADLRDLVLDKVRSIPGVLTTRTSIILDESPHRGLPGEADVSQDGSTTPWSAS